MNCILFKIFFNNSYIQISRLIHNKFLFKLPGKADIYTRNHLKSLPRKKSTLNHLLLIKTNEDDCITDEVTSLNSIVRFFF